MSKAPTHTLPSFEIVREPLLQFHPDNEQSSDVHPLRGINNYGPFSKSISGYLPETIRLAIVCPEGCYTKVANLMHELQSRHQPRERKNYLVPFEGFNSTFGVGLHISAKESGQVIEIPRKDLSNALRQQEPHVQLAEILLRSIRQLSLSRTQFDVVLVYLPNDLAIGFEAKDLDNEFDLHDSIKAVCSTLQMPVQVINDGALQYYCRCSVSWRLSLALYAKAGGIPWKLKAVNPRHAYIGIGYSLRKSSNSRFVTCCSQIFDEEGANLQFLLYESSDGSHDGQNPFLPRREMHRVMARTLSLYQKQRGFTPDRLVVHKTTRFTTDEVDGCNDALNSVSDVELLSFTQNIPWKGIKIQQSNNQTNRKGVPAGYPIERGTALPLGSYDYLLWTQGNCSSIGSNDFYKEGKGIPFPIRITRHQGSGGFHDSAAEILGLTKMNWNNDGLYDRLPVSLSYASVLARVIKRMGSLSQTPYNYRYFM